MLLKHVLILFLHSFVVSESSEKQITFEEA